MIHLSSVAININDRHYMIGIYVNPAYIYNFKHAVNVIGLLYLYVNIYHTPVFWSAFWMVYPVISVLPLSLGGVHSRAALKPQVSTSFTLAGGPGSSEDKYYCKYLLKDLNHTQHVSQSIKRCLHPNIYLYSNASNVGPYTLTAAAESRVKHFWVKGHHC